MIYLYLTAEKVKFMVILAEFTRAMDWILSEGFTFYESVSSAVFKAPTSERFITRTTPTLVYTDMPGLGSNQQYYELSIWLIFMYVSK